MMTVAISVLPHTGRAICRLSFSMKAGWSTTHSTTYSRAMQLGTVNTLLTEYDTLKDVTLDWIVQFISCEMIQDTFAEGTALEAKHSM